MTTVLLETATRLFPETQDRPDGGQVTLEERLEAAWTGLRAAGVAECPLCHGSLSLRGGEGWCDDCGSRLC